MLARQRSGHSTTTSHRGLQFSELLFQLLDITVSRPVSTRLAHVDQGSAGLTRPRLDRQSDSSHFLITDLHSTTKPRQDSVARLPISVDPAATAPPTRSRMTNALR